MTKRVQQREQTGKTDSLQGFRRGNPKDAADECITCVGLGGGTPSNMDDEKTVTFEALTSFYEPPQQMATDGFLKDLKVYRWHDIGILDDGTLFEGGLCGYANGNLEDIYRPVTDDEVREFLLDRVPLLARLFSNTEGVKAQRPKRAARARLA